MLQTHRAPPSTILLVAVVTSALAAARAQALDPTTADCLTASESSLKLRSEHKLRAAREQLLVCSLAACPVDIRAECARRVEIVNSAIPTIVFEAKDGSGNDVANVKVTLDGAPLVDRLEGTAISLDPGEHAFRFETPGQAPVEKVLVLREGEKERRERIALAPPAPVGPASVDVMQDAKRSDGKTQRIGAVVAGGAGVLGAVLGTIFGVSASSSWSAAQNDCGKSCAPTNPAVGERSTAQTDAAISTVGFVTAGVGLAAGALLWFTAPHLRPPTTPIGLAPMVGPAGGGVVLQW